MARVRAKLLAIAFFALLFFGAAATVSDAFVFGLRAQAEVSVAKAPLWQAKCQPGGRVNLVSEFDIGSRLRFASALGYHYTGRSNLAGGALYRAFSGVDLRSGFAIAGKGGSSRFSFGMAAGGFARLDAYRYTKLFFFYPGVYLEPLLEGRPERPWQNHWQLGFPIELSFRKDLELCLSAGIALTLPIFPSRIWKPWEYR